MRAFGYSVATDIAAGTADATRTSMCKVALCEAAQRVIAGTVACRADAGVDEAMWFERVLRDSRVLSIGGGTSELMRDIIGSRIVQQVRGSAPPALGGTAWL